MSGHTSKEYEKKNPFFKFSVLCLLMLTIIHPRYYRSKIFMHPLNTNAHNDNEHLGSQLSAWQTECYKHNFLVLFYDNW